MVLRLSQSQRKFQVSFGILRRPAAPAIVAAILVRLVVMPTTMHTDTVWMPWMAFQIVRGHWNVYQYLFDTYGQRTLTPVVWAPYLPLYYFITAGWTGLLKILGIIDVGAWWFDSQRWYIPNLSLSLFLVKTLYLPFDVAIAWGISRLVTPERRSVAVALWLLCPVVLVSTYMMGQNDIIATAPVVLATVAGERVRRQVMDGGCGSPRLIAASAILLGLGAACKSYPLLLVVPFALVIGRDVRSVLQFILLGMAPYFLAIAPFVRSHPFQAGVLFNPEAQSIFAAVPGIGPFGISPFVTAYAGFIAALIVHRFQPFDLCFDLPTVAFIVIGLIFVTSSWPFYWLVWLMPFAIWSAVQNSITYVHLSSYCAIFLAWTWNWGTKVSSGLFAPLLPLASNIPPVRAIVNTYYPWDHLMILAQSILVGVYITHLLVIARRGDVRKEVSFSPLLQFLGLQCQLLGWIVISFIPFFIHR